MLGFACAGSAGGGLAVFSVDAPQAPYDCDASYFPFTYNLEATIVDAVVKNNTARTFWTSAVDLPSGGGVYFECGGFLTILRSTFEHNSAHQFGGGLSLGGSGATQACGGNVSDSVFTGNTANHGGAQVSMSCAADLHMSNTTMHLGRTFSEVRGVGVVGMGRWGMGPVVAHPMQCPRSPPFPCMLPCAFPWCLCLQAMPRVLLPFLARCCPCTATVGGVVMAVAVLVVEGGGGRVLELLALN